MSFQAMAWAVQQELPMREKMVLLMLANYASNERGDCHPSVGLLSKDCGSSKDSVMRAVKALEESGHLTVNRRTKDGVNLPNTYTLQMRGVVAESDHGGSRTQLGGVVAESDTNLSVEPITSLRSVSTGAGDLVAFRHEVSALLETDLVETIIISRRKKRAAINGNAGRLLVKALQKCPDPKAAAEEMALRGWTGIKPEWLERAQSRGSPTPAPAPQMSDVFAFIGRKSSDDHGPEYDHSGRVRQAIPHLQAAGPKR